MRDDVHLSRRYFRIWEDYDRRYQLTAKYESVRNRVSKEAQELDRQYKIRNRALTIWSSGSRSAQRIGASAAAGTAAFLQRTTGKDLSQSMHLGNI
jgi:hypothetical protein